MKINVTLLAILVGAQLWGAAALANASGDWQLAMIHQPSSAQLTVEDRGRVFIYDRLSDADVELAMNTQFHRLDHMMFVRTKVETAKGVEPVIDDGCE